MNEYALLISVSSEIDTMDRELRRRTCGCKQRLFP